MRFINNTYIRWVSSITLAVFACSGFSQSIHISHCMADCPQSPSTNSDIVVRHLYVAEINSDNGLADWVAYRVLENSVGVASLFPRWWQQDELLPDSTVLEADLNQPLFDQPDLSDAQDRDYRVNEVVFTTEDRGRLAPITSFADTPYWEELNNLSNMAPLPSALRAGPWSRLEMAINELAANEDELYVISGPLYEITGSLNIRRASANLPSSYFKIVATETQYAAFIMAADLPINAEYCDQIASAANVQELSGLTLFPALETALAPGLYEGLRCQNLVNLDAQE